MNAFRNIIRPTVATVERVKVLNIGIQPLLRELAPVLLQPKIGKDAEPEPVRVGHARRLSAIRYEHNVFISRLLLLVDGVSQPIFDIPSLPFV